MIFKLCPKHKGAHTHFRVFVGEKEGALALAGKLTLRREEGTLFIATLLTGATHSDGEASIIISYDEEYKTGKLPS